MNDPAVVDGDWEYQPMRLARGMSRPMTGLNDSHNRSPFLVPDRFEAFADSAFARPETLRERWRGN